MSLYRNAMNSAPGTAPSARAKLSGSSPAGETAGLELDA